MEYLEKQNLIVMDLVDLEHCGFDYREFEDELRLAGIEQKQAACPLALLINFGGGHILTEGMKEETLKRYKKNRTHFKALVEFIKKGCDWSANILGVKVTTTMS